jgi:hypothetical protein
VRNICSAGTNVLATEHIYVARMIAVGNAHRIANPWQGPARMSDPVIIEPVPLTDVFVNGIARIEIIGHNARFFLYSEQSSFDQNQPPDRYIVAKIIIPLEDLPEAIRKAMAVSVGEAANTVVGTLKKLVALH